MARDAVDVGLFVTCLADLFRPSVGFAAVKLLEDAGCRVHVPAAQTCCGQPAFNSGDFKSARTVAAQVIEAFEGFDYVIAPSGSCAGMIRVHFAELFENDAAMAARAQSLADRTYELVSFLTDVRGVDKVVARYDGVVTYHDSCSGLRELGIKDQPRRLLASVDGLTLNELPGAEECCGFGGTFCVKYPDVSVKIVSEKTTDIAATFADTLLAGDLGCLMNMAGRLSSEGRAVKVRHVAEVLAGMTDMPPIAGRESEGG
jgi:L-lactate dehydrogenase complex protein LldE